MERLETWSAILQPGIIAVEASSDTSQVQHAWILNQDEQQQVDSSQLVLRPKRCEAITSNLTISCA